MKIMLISDPHLREKEVVCREEDMYNQVSFKKIIQIRDLYKKHKVDTVVLAGDVFDRGKDPNHLLLTAMGKHWKYMNFIGIKGQHDINPDTGTGAYDVLPDLLNSFDDISKGIRHALWLSKYVCFHGSTLIYNPLYESVKSLQVNKDFTNVLVLHHPIGYDKGLRELKVIKYPLRDLMNDPIFTKFDIILYADIHEPYIVSHEDTLWVNTGPLVRTGISAKDHRPHVVIVDTETMIWNRHFLESKMNIKMAHWEKLKEDKEMKKIAEGVKEQVKDNSNESVIKLLREKMELVKSDMDGMAYSWLWNKLEELEKMRT